MDRGPLHRWKLARCSEASSQQGGVDGGTGHCWLWQRRPTRPVLSADRPDPSRFPSEEEKATLVPRQQMFQTSLELVSSPLCP